MRPVPSISKIAEVCLLDEKQALPKSEQRYSIGMRRILPLCCAAMMAAACLAATPELKQVKKVYFLQLTGGIDQYLAQHLITGNTIEVVTDPALADAIFSDRIGETLEQKLTELYPPPPSPRQTCAR